MRWLLALALMCAACGEDRVRPGATDGGRAGFEIVDVSDPDALAGCYAPLRVPGVEGQTTQNCATECVRASICASICADPGQTCPPGDGMQGQAGACDRDSAESLRRFGYEVPKWPLKRCDDEP